jgi:peptidyl-prolyl cis-trans isomerase SurA|uniref:peptidylprolyl isomerase n=2 Tax=Orrella sp. TaxID=1921583 RepID=UPI0040478D1C
MILMKRAAALFFGLLLLALSAQTHGQGLRGSNEAPVRASVPVDGIAAVVGGNVITVLEVDQRASLIAGEIRNSRQPMPAQDEIKRQALDMLITESLIRQEGEKMGVRISDQELARAVESVAKRNNVTIAQIKNQVKAVGLTWPQYEDRLRREMTVDRVRQAMAESTIRISDADVDVYLKEQVARKASGLEPPPPPPPPPPKPQPVRPLVMQLAQIFIQVPESASEEQVAALKKRIDGIRANLRKGQDFAVLATENSDGPEASRGGDMGVRPAEGWPSLFINNARNLQAGQISGVLRSPAGFHILKVLGRAGGVQPAPPPPPEPVLRTVPDGPLMVDQTKARHILIKTSEVMSDDQARQRLENARQRIVNGGESFEAVARAVSDDASAPQGGDLGWLNPGDTVPPFERGMNSLDVGQLSEPVKTEFGWHLIEVLERRSQDMADQYRRNLAREELFLRRAASNFDAWLQQVRNQTFVDNRMFRPDAK